jgi:hypothetical protein
MMLSDAQYAQFLEDGYLILGKIATDEELHSMNHRLDQLMLGEIQYGDKLLMQIDPNAPEVKSAAAVTDVKNEYEIYKAQANETQNQGRDGVGVGFKFPSMAYRKIGEAHCGLEVDPIFHAFQSKPLFRDICGRAYGRHAPISIYRSMVMCKPQGDLGGGSPLPYHQDGGLWWALDRDPLVFVWVALTEATLENGAVQVVKGSHKNGLLSKRGHTLTPDQVKEVCDDHPELIVNLELKPGEAALVHNFTVHRSSINTTSNPRRGFSVNYIDGRTKVLDPKPEGSGPIGVPGDSFPVVFPSKFD